MKFLRPILFLTIFLILAECNKTEDYELAFGETQTGFKLDSIYVTKTNGLLYVNFISNSTGAYLHVLTSNDANPDIEVAMFRTGGSATVPLQKNIYWKVEKHPDYDPLNLPILDTLITWTPIY